MWTRVIFFSIAISVLFNGAICDSNCVTLDTGAVIVTSTCTDTTYNNVTIDSETDELSPVAHRMVSAHFDVVDVNITVILPPKAQWKGRFFQYVYPTQSAVVVPENIAFAVDSGAYWVQIAGVPGYRADAAAAKFARKLASAYYEDTTSHIYGYIFGGSGGSYQTTGAMENTDGIWDGAVAFIQGSLVANPSDFSPRHLVGLVAHDKADVIINAVSPGGSGNPYDGLAELQSSVLHEAISMGVPLFSWEDFERVGGSESMRLLNVTFRDLDPTFENDFWSVSGYAGTDQSELGDFFRAALVNYTTTITEVLPGLVDDSPATIVLQDLPDISDPLGMDFTVFDDTNTNIGIVWGTLDVAAKTVALYSSSNATTVASLTANMTVTVDNKWYLAFSTYHRHQLPAVDSGFVGFDQFRDAAGNPLYVQRTPLMFIFLSNAASGTAEFSGNITSPMIVLDTMMDSDAYPYYADWYRSRVESSLGNRTESSYRLYYNDHSNHDPYGIADNLLGQLVPFEGSIQFALRDVADWVENGEEPADNSNYTTTGSQVSLHGNAQQRHGIQPVASLLADGTSNATVAVGQTVSFSASLEVPAGNSKIVAVEWDFVGSGNFTSYPLESPETSLQLEVKHAYSTAGTYLPVVRVISQREGNMSSPFARSMNLGRARVVAY